MRSRIAKKRRFGTLRGGWARPVGDRFVRIRARRALGVSPWQSGRTKGATGNISSTDVSLLNVLSQPVTAEVKAIHSDPFNLLANVGDVINDYDPTAPDGMQYDGGTENDGDSGFIDTALHGQYTGTGTYDIDVDLTQWLDYGSIGGIEVAFTPVNATGTVTVIYNYVPEPATVCLLALGGLAVIRRKRR